MPSEIALFLPPLAAALSYLFQQEHWPSSIPVWAHTWINGSIALIMIVLSVTVDLLIQNKLTGSITGDVLLIGVATTALQVETFRPLQQYLREIGFTPSPPPPQEEAIIPNSPTPIILPPASSTPVPMPLDVA